MIMFGHNNGPTMEAGYGWRKQCWTKARKDLLPTLPIEVLRTRVKRAKALGLPYKTYASVRAASGHDVVGFLFSNNALRVLRPGQVAPASRVARLADIEAKLAALVHRPLDPLVVQDQFARQGINLHCAQAPHFADSWSKISSEVLAPIREAGLPKDGVLVIGDTSDEREWSAAAKLAGFMNSEQFFRARP